MFKRVSADSELFNQINAAETAGKQRFDYDGLAFAYNGLPVGEMLTFEWAKEKIPTLKAQLEKRGIVHSVDYTVKPVVIDELEHAAITRGTDKATVKVPSKPRGPRKKNAEAADSAPAADATETTPRRRGKSE